MKKFLVLLSLLSATAFAGSTWYPGGGSGSGGVTSVTGTAPIVSSGGATPAISITQSSLTGDGYLSSGDWRTFNGKDQARTVGNLTEATSAVLTISSGTGAVIGSGTTIQVTKAAAAANGYLGSADWQTFNSRQAALGYTPVNQAGDTMTGTLNLPANGLVVGTTQLVAASGRVGIGTATPGFALDVYGGSNIAGMTVHGATNNTTSALGIVATGPSANDSAVMLWNTAGTPTQWTFRANTNHNFEFIDTSAGQLDMVITGSGAGNVGIGTQTPASRLDVRGNMAVGTYAGVNAAPANGLVVSGSVGIGSSNPGAKLEVKDGHYKSTQTTAATATVNANAGTGASCTVSNPTDTAGTINLTTTAIAGSSGVVCDINFNSSYGVAPICVTTPASANAIVDAVIQGVFFTTATTKLSVNFANTDAVGRTYNWTYHCIETQ